VCRGSALLTGMAGSRGRGPDGGRQPHGRRGPREREREREGKGGCLTPTDGRRPTASGPRPAGAGGVA
jgi:hypothetical protein